MTQIDMFPAPAAPQPTWEDLFVGKSTAIFSPCRTYRTGLSRDMGATESPFPPLVCIGLNPSTADHRIDDPTIRKDQHFTTAWGFGRFIKLNAYDYRSTDPAAMFKAQKAGKTICSPENNQMILRVVNRALELGGKIWVAWGAKIEPARQREIAMDLLGDVELWCIDANQNGTPVHELYQKNESVLRLWTERCVWWDGQSR